MTSPHVRPGEVLAGRYRVDRELGAGAMGVVYAAWHLDLDHAVALKVVTAPITDVAAATARFRREVRAAAKIRSEHVARVLDVGATDSGVPYMVLELLEGNDLECELERRGPVSVSDAVDYVLQAIEALAEAHAAGIVHRDLKPANLFLAERPDKTRIIKVLDFGISKSILGDSASGQLSLTQTGVMMGSPLYMSPEQMQSARDTDARCDIWALGVVLYQLLSGRLPFRGDNILELCASVFRDRPPPISSLRVDVPEGLDRVIATCLARERELRFQNVADLATALVEFAPPHAHVHRDRAVRVLFPNSAPRTTTQPHAISASPSHGASAPALFAAASSSPGLAGDDRNAATKASPMYQALDRQTQAAWNATKSTTPSRLKKRVGGALLMGAIGVGVALLFWQFSARTKLVSSEHAATPANSELGSGAAASNGSSLPIEGASQPAAANGSAAVIHSPSVIPMDAGGLTNAEPLSHGASQPPTSKQDGTIPSKKSLVTTPFRRGNDAQTRPTPSSPRKAAPAELPDYGGRR